MTVNRVKQGRAVTFMKHLASVVSLTVLPNKITFSATNFLNLAELAVNELMKRIFKKFINITLEIK